VAAKRTTGHRPDVKPAVGLDIGATSVRAALIAPRKGENRPATILRLAEQPLPDETFAAGKLVNSKALTSAVKALWRKGHLRPRTAWFNLPEDIVLTRRTSAPWLVDEDFGKALRYQVADALPIDVDTVELDYYSLGDRDETQSSGRTTKMKDILLVAAPTADIDARARALLAARVEPQGTDTSAFPLIRAACVGLGQDDGQVHAIVDIGSAQLTAVVHRTGVPLFVRGISKSAGHAAVLAVAEALDLHDDLAEATRLAASVGLTGAAPIVAGVAESSVFAHLPGAVDSAGTSLDGDTADQRTRDTAARALDPWANSLVREIRQTLDYYSASADQPITTVTLAGRTAAMPGLIERLATSIPYRVLRFDPLAGLAAHRRVRRNAPVDSRFATAIGLALGTVA